MGLLGKIALGAVSLPLTAIVALDRLQEAVTWSDTAVSRGATS
jgi:hypothetical protein